MNYRYITLLIAAIVVHLTPATIAEAQDSDKRMVSYNELVTASRTAPDAERLVYGNLPLQFGELRLPAGTAPVPLVVFLHGGCWLSAYDVTHTRAFTAGLASEGYAVWSPEYRRVGDSTGGWPGTFDDVAQAVDFVPQIATRYPRIDATRVIVVGHSAGGQLALWAVSRVEREAFTVRGVVSLAGITDLAKYGEARGSCNTAVNRLMGGSAQDVPERYQAASPIMKASMTVPVRIVHGAQDPIVPIEQSTTFAEKYNSAGGTRAIEIDVIPDAGHFDLVAPQGAAWLALLRALRALVGS